MDKSIQHDGEKYRYRMLDYKELILLISSNNDISTQIDDLYRILKPGYKYPTISFLKGGVILESRNQIYAIVLVEKNDEIVGICRVHEEKTSRKDNRVVNIGSVVISPTHRRKNLCSIMLKNTVELLNNMDRIQIIVNKNNPNALRCYTSVGFKQVGHIIYDGEEHHELVYSQ